MIKDLLIVLSAYPALSKAASAALINLGDAMQENATVTEINGLLEGALVNEAHIRLACLQALQVGSSLLVHCRINCHIQPLDLTDFEFSKHLWLLCHDDDERNQKLAETIWEENGLDVPETFLPDMLPYLSEFRRLSAKHLK